MSLRTLLVALILAIAPHGVARAQEASPAAPAESTISESELALRDFYQALFFDTGMYDAIVEAMFPSLREQVMASDYYRSAGRRDREVFDRMLESMPQIVREEIIAESAVMAQNIRERADAILPANDVRAISAMIRDPELRPMMQRLAVSGAQGSREEPTPEERAQMEAAAAHLSPAVFERGAELMDLVMSELDAAEPRVQARLQRRVARETCAALGSRCPADLREQAT
jgi:hypothetical protein